MKEISEKLRNTILAAIPTTNLVLFYAPLYGTNPTIIDRILAANNGTFTNPKWKTLKNGLVVPSYDGTAYIKNSTANWRSADSQGAIGVWFKTGSVASRNLFASCDEASATRYLTINKAATLNVLLVNQRNNDTRDTVAGATNVSDSKWHSVFLTSDGSVWAILLDGVPETLTVTSGLNTGDWFADTSARDNFTVGVQIANVAAFYWDGQIGLVVVYSVAPTTAQILRMSNRLKGVFH